MKIAFDATSAAFEKKTGTGVYTEEVIKAYKSTFPEDVVVNTYRLARRFKGASYLSRPFHTLIDPLTFWRGYAYDLFHGLNARLPLLCGSPMIVTIHDLFSVLGDYSNEEFKKDQKEKYLSTLKRANHIITPALFTKKQLVNTLGINAEKVSVVGEGVREIFLNDNKNTGQEAAFKKKFNIQKPFFLFVGTLEKRKNVIGIIKAFSEFNKKNPNTHQLVLIGGAGYGYEDIKSEILQQNLAGAVVELGFLNESDLALFYRYCLCFIFLSFEEGYGIPVIESMACGAPVISSNTTSLPEVGGGHTFLVDPQNSSLACQFMEKISKKEESVLAQAERGKKYAQLMTWSKVAQSLRDVYKEVISSHQRR